MSAERGSERAPDLTEAVLGFRAWMLRIDGGLGAVVAGSIWQPGPNEAVCSPDVTPSRRPRHSSPHSGCNCGFNAYFALGPRLRGGEHSVVGAIAAWGEIDVYADGFRAQFAQVIALAQLPYGPQGPGLERRQRAADRYDVPLVAITKLRAEALRHATPLAPAMLPKSSAVASRPRRRPTPSPPPRPNVAVANWKRARGRSLWVGRHVAVRAGEGELGLGPAPGAAALAGPEPEVLVAAAGTRVAAGDCVARLTAGYPGELIHLRTPVGGRISGHNPAFAAQLRDGDRAVSAAPCLLRLEPDDEPLEDAPLLWGRPGVELYRRAVAGRSDADVLAELAAPAGFDATTLDALALAPPAPALAAHQRATTSLSPAQGRRAAIMVEHLRPLLVACGEPGTLLAA